MQHTVCCIQANQILNFRNHSKFTLTDDKNFYKKVIPENELDVNLDDECKLNRTFPKSQRASKWRSSNLKLSYVPELLSEHNAIATQTKK